MNGDDEILSKALLAMKAVTAGALLCAGLSCFPDDDRDDEASTPTPRQEAQEQEEGESSETTTSDEKRVGADEIDEPDDASDPSSEDSEDDTDRRDADDGESEEAAAGDPIEDVDPFDDTDHDGDDDDEEVAAAGGDDQCNAQESTGHCPEGCTTDEDVDCCEETPAGCWVGGVCRPCAIPGPFVPPKMIV